MVSGVNAAAAYRWVISIGLCLGGGYLAYNLFQSGMDTSLLVRTAMIILVFVLGAAVLRGLLQGGGTRSEL